MKKLCLLCTVLLTADAAGHGGAAGPASPVAPPGNLSPTFPLKGVDQMVTYASWRGWGPKGGDRVILLRHGALVRSETIFIGSRRAGEDDDTTEFANLDTGASIGVVRDDKGDLSSVMLAKGGLGDSPIYRHTLARTGRSETIAGEKCTEWLAKPVSKDGVPYSACITSDGVTLRETVLFSDGSVLDEKLAIRVERRPVRAEEVLPPVEALDWSRWGASNGTGGAGDYELHLTGSLDDKPATKVMRKAGDWQSEEDRSDGTIRRLLIFSPATTLSYFYDGRTQMTVSRKKVFLLTDPRALESAPLVRPPQTVVGETCTWYNAAVNVADYGREECRTRDQLPMIRNEYSWGTRSSSWTATALKRTPMSLASVAPPPAIMDWTFWGWPQLAGRR